MVALRVIKSRPQPPGVVVEVGELGRQRNRELFACGVDRVLALAGAGGERVGLQPRRLDGIEVGGKLALGVGESLAQRRDVAVGRHGPRADGGQLGERDPLDVLVEDAPGDRGRGGALAAAVMLGAGVRGAGEAHDVPAPGAADEAREQRGVRSALRWPGHPGVLNCVPELAVHDRGVRGGVDVLAYAQLAEVDAVSQELAGAAGRHPQVAGDLADGLADQPVGERLADPGGVGAGGEAARVGVARVAERGLPALPDAARRGFAAGVLERFGVALALGDVHRALDPADHPAVDGLVVDGVEGHDDFAACRLDAAEHRLFLDGVAEQAGLVGDDDPDVLAGLDAADGGEQRWALLERQPAADVVLGRQQVQRVAGRHGVADRLLLAAVGVQRVRPDLAVAEMADSYDACPGRHGRASYLFSSSPGTRGVGQQI